MLATERQCKCCLRIKTVEMFAGRSIRCRFCVDKAGMKKKRKYTPRQYEKMGMYYSA